MKNYFSLLAISTLYTACIFAGSVDSDQLRSAIQHKINDLEKGHQILNRAIKQRAVITPTDIKTYKDMLHKAAQNTQELNRLSQEIRDYIQETSIALFYILNAMLENDLKNIQLLKNNALKKVYTKSVDNFRATLEDLKGFFNQNRDSVVKFYEKVEKTVGDFKELFNKIVKDLKAQRTEPINLSLKSISESALRGKSTALSKPIDMGPVDIDKEIAAAPIKDASVVKATIAERINGIDQTKKMQAQVIEKTHDATFIFIELELLDIFEKQLYNLEKQLATMQNAQELKTITNRINQLDQDMTKSVKESIEDLYKKVIDQLAQAHVEFNKVPMAHPSYNKLKTKLNGLENQIKTQIARLKEVDVTAFYATSALAYNDLKELLTQLKQASKEEMHILPVIEEESGEFTTQDPRATITAMADILSKIQKAQELARQKITGVDFNLISEKQLASYQAQCDALKQEIAVTKDMSMVDEKVNTLGQSITEAIDRGTDHINNTVKALINQIKFNFAQVDAPDKKKFNSLQYKADYYLTHVVRKKEDDPVAFYQLAILSYNDIKQALE